MFRTLGLLAGFSQAAKAKRQFIKLVHSDVMQTPAAIDRLKVLMSNNKDNNTIGVKVSLTKRGCNGLSYNMNYISKPDRFDEVVEEEGLKLVIDSKALLALVGTELDYVVTDTSEEFVFKNPNEKGKCGCGESFHV